MFIWCKGGLFVHLEDQVKALCYLIFVVLEASLAFF